MVSDFINSKLVEISAKVIAIRVSHNLMQYFNRNEIVIEREFVNGIGRRSNVISRLYTGYRASFNGIGIVDSYATVDEIIFETESGNLISYIVPEEWLQSFTDDEFVCDAQQNITDTAPDELERIWNGGC